MKTRPDKPNDDKHEELRQQLWELAYGLLEPHEESALVARVKSDPALARLYAEVKLQTDLVQTAARVEDSSLSISAQGPSVASPVSVNKEKRSAAKSSSRAIPAAKATGGSFGTNWLAVVGTTALLLLLGYGLWQPDVVTTSVAQGEYYYTRVTGLAAMTEGVTQKVGVEYKDIHNNGRATELAVRLVDQEGRETYRTKVKTADDGRAEVDLPGTVLKKGVRLEVEPTDERAERPREAEVVSTELHVAAEKRKTVLLTERPYAEAGESNRFQLFGVGEYSKSITPPATDELVVEKQSGGVVVQPMWTVDQANGVISGEYKLPQTYAADEGLAMRRRGLNAAREESKQQAAPQTNGSDARLAAGAALGGRGGANESAAKAKEQERQLARAESRSGESLELQRALNGVAKAELAKSSQAKAGNAERDQKPGEPGEGGEVAPFGGSRPGMMRSTGPAGAAASPPSPPSAPAPPAPAAGLKPENMAPAAPAETMNRKNAAFAPAPGGLRSADKPPADAAPAKPGNSPPQDPQPKESLQGKDRQLAQQEKFTVPAPTLAEPTGQELEKLSGVAETKKFAEARKTIESLKELSVQVPEQARGDDLVLVARDGDGRVVARRELAAHKEADARVSLPPEVHGLVDVELFRKDQPASPVLRQQLVRASARSLQFEVFGLREVYAPGEKVQLAVRVVDELGQPAAAAASVRVWNDAAARAAGSPLLLVDSLTQNDLADEAAEKAAAPAAALAAGAPGGSEQDRAGAADGKAAPETPAFESAPVADPVASEVFFVDNRSAVQQEYDRAIAIHEMQRSEQRQSFGRVLMWSGAGLMLLVGALLLARRPLKSTVWIPAVGLAALSLALGVSWFLPLPQPSRQLAQVLPDETEQTAGTVPGESDAVPSFKSAPTTRLPLPESPIPSDAPVAEVAPGAPSDPGAPGAAIGGGQGGGASSVDRNLGADKQADFRKGEQFSPEKRQSEIKPRADVAPFAGQAAAKKSDGDAAKRDQLAEGRLSDQLPPDSLFWRPLSPIDQNGTFTIEFTMPAAESDYRLLIDAIGSGRIGGKEQLLRCRAE